MISLIVATLNRVEPLDRLLTSLQQQSCRDFEVIVVDQNRDDRLTPVLANHERLSIQHLRCEPGASRARNLGLRHVNGQIVAFPDDDCWYPPDLLRAVQQWFAVNPRFSGLFTALRDEQNQLIGPRWPPLGRPFNREDLWHFGMTAVGFLRAGIALHGDGFNEQLGGGSGTAYHAGEDVDYFVRLLHHGLAIWYEPALTVHHPRFRNERESEKSYSYPLSGGYVLRVHRYPVRMLVSSVVRSIGGMIVSLFNLDLSGAHSYFLRAIGVLRGYFLGPHDLRKAQHVGQRAAHA